MEYQFTPEQRLLHNLVLHSNDVPARGLFDGQMGIVLVLSEYVRARKMRPLKTAINFLLDQVLDNLSTEMPLEFANGLTGIGWGVEYLLQNRFQRGQGADICTAIDQKLMQQNILRQIDLSLDKGLEGWLHYIVAHVQGAQQVGRHVFDSAYLQDSLAVCRHLLQQDISPSLRLLCQAFDQMMQGQPIQYTFDLSAFVAPNIKRNTPMLSLHSGMAGLIFTHINQKQA